MPVICWPISPVAFESLFRQRLHFGRHDGEAAAGLAGAGRLDGGVERQQIGLLGDGVDEFDHRADAGGRLRQFADPVIGGAGLIDGLVGHPRRCSTWRPISVMDEAISSVEEATDCTLVEASSEAAATIVVEFLGAFGGRRQRAGGGFERLVDAADTVSTISPTAPSKSSASLIVSALRRCAATWSCSTLASGFLARSCARRSRE